MVSIRSVLYLIAYAWSLRIWCGPILNKAAALSFSIAKVNQVMEAHLKKVPVSDGNSEVEKKIYKEYKDDEEEGSDEEEENDSMQICHR